MSRTAVQSSIDYTNTVILGKQQQIKLAFACLLAGGHLLLDDRPGTGKTRLAKTLAQCLNLNMARIQFTSDLMPSDILGVSVFQHEEMVFHPGPIFNNIILADEINRASSRTQSALLEAMAEHQVSIDGKTYGLPSPFFVIATQNPIDFSGTHSLPEAQADRFMLNLELGYPDSDFEKQILLNLERFDDSILNPFKPLLNSETILNVQAEIAQINISENLVDILYKLINQTRQEKRFNHGLSTRAGMQILKLARAVAYLDGENSVFPEHISEVFVQAAQHRIQLRKSSNPHEIQGILNEFLSSI